MIGYKVMRISDCGNFLVSGMNSNLTFPINTKNLSMPGNGIYLGIDKQYVLDYYSELAEKEALLTVEFDENNIITGCLEDIEPEVSIGQVKIVTLEIL